MTVSDPISVLVVGRGKLAKELLDGLRGPTIARVLPWSERSTLTDATPLVVHAGSGRELAEVIDFCALSGALLLDLSTGDSRLPEVPRFPIVLCPNVNMQMLYFMALVKQASQYFAGQDILIEESHQAAKKTKPGTAIYLAKSLGVPEAAIRSVRDPKVQVESLGIPLEFVDRHARHEIVIRDPEVEIRLQTRVLGKSAYATGLAKVIEIVGRSALAAGFHDIVELVMADARRMSPSTPSRS
jgi:hypothetical protein